MIYLDNAATTLQKPPCVGQAVLDALAHGGNPGRGAHEPTLHAARLVYHAREALATLLHAESPDCIAFTANVTQALNTALSGLVRPGDHVITTVCEHNSVLRPLYRLREQGAQVSFVEVDGAGRLRYDQFEGLLRPNTRFVAVTHASNVTGNLTDLAFVSAFAKKHGLTLIVDAAQTAGARPIDVQALAAEHGMSYTWLRRMFRKNTGIAPAQYLQQLRIHMSMYLLRNTDAPIKNIAVDSGFKTPEYFCAVFQEATGMTPKEYRTANNDDSRSPSTDATIL